MTKLQHLSEEVLNLWNKWEIRGMVLLSLLLQIILITFGSRRKTIARSWIRILVWSAYLSADIVATVALGNLARSQGNSLGDGSTKANNSIQAFWAPFLLLHLGGPDTITAYSIEDNELWSRHALGLALQVVIAFYVFSRSWGSNILTFIAIPTFIVGIIKYAERTWVLRSSCSKHMKDYSLSIGGSISLTKVQESLRAEFRESFRAEEESYLLPQAYFFFHISRFMMQHLLPGTYSLYYSQSIISAKSAEDAFKIVEIELGLIYDRLYTKGPLIYSCMGIILRSITFLLSFAAFVTFAVMIDKHAYSTTDLTITYSLLVGALVLEIYAFLCLVFSDRTMIWLIGEGGNAQTSQICRAIYSLIGKLTTSKRWSRSIAQHNLISSCIEDKPVKGLELFEMMKEMYVIREDMNVGLQGFIFGHLQKKGKMIMENFDFIDTNFRSKIIDQRGDGVLEGMGVLEGFKWCTTGVEFSHSIVVWHLATDICFYSDEKVATKEERETSKWLSEYMMFLLVNRPNMLPQGIGDLGYSYRDTWDHLMDIDLLGRKIDNESRRREFIRNYNESRLRNPMGGEYNKSAVADGVKLAKQILGFEKLPWEMINEVWIEMLAHAAAHCPWKEHAQELRRGGELLTHVSFLMLHFGLSQQYQFSGEDVDLYRGLPREDKIKFQKAVIRAKLIDKVVPWLQEEINERERTKGRAESSGGQGLVHDKIEEAPQPIGANYSRLSSNIALKKVEELKKSSLGEIIETHAENSSGQRLVHHEIEEVPQPIGANYSPLSSNIALKKVEELEKVVANKDRELVYKDKELDRNKIELEHKERELEHKERELEYKDQELEQMRSLLAASTQQQRLDAFPRGSSTQSEDQGTSNEIRLNIY